MNADVYDGVPAPADWWDPIRSQVMYALDIPDAPIANRRTSPLSLSTLTLSLWVKVEGLMFDLVGSKAVVTYVDRQSVSKRRISEATHESLMQALYEVEEENIARQFFPRTTGCIYLSLRCR